MSDVVKHEVFGNPENPSIYYLTGYGSTLKQTRPHIGFLQLAGFKVVGFEYDKAILNAGDPLLLPQAIDYIQDTVESDASTNEVAGIYGMSLGGFIGFNVLKRTNIERAIFNTGGVSILDTVWNNSHMSAEKQSFEAAGYTHAEMARLWQDIDKPEELSAKKVLLMISEADKVLSPIESRHNFEQWKDAGVDGELIVSKWLGHGPVIFRNIFRLKRTIDFFRHVENS